MCVFALPPSFATQRLTRIVNVLLRITKLTYGILQCSTATRFAVMRQLHNLARKRDVKF